MTLTNELADSIVYYDSELTYEERREVRFTALDHTPIGLDGDWVECLFDNIAYYLVQSYRAKMYRKNEGRH